MNSIKKTSADHKPTFLLIKALIPYLDSKTGKVSESSPYRTLSINSNTSLTVLGELVLEAFDFECDHLFGFYDNIKRYYSSKVCYEHHDFITASEDFNDFGSESINRQVFDMDDIPAIEIFTRKGKRWLMLFDYRDE